MSRPCSSMTGREAARHDTKEECQARGEGGPASEAHHATPKQGIQMLGNRTQAANPSNLHPWSAWEYPSSPQTLPDQPRAPQSRARSHPRETSVHERSMPTSPSLARKLPRWIPARPSLVRARPSLVRVARPQFLIADRTKIGGLPLPSPISHRRWHEDLGACQRGGPAANKLRMHRHGTFDRGFAGHRPVGFKPGEPR